MSTQALVSVKPGDSVNTAIQIMLWADVVHLPVVGERGEVAGVVSARDLVGQSRRSGRVEQFMTSPAVTVTPDEDVADAATTMVARRIGCLPVIEEGLLVGILTMGDLVAYNVGRTLHPDTEPSPTLGMFATPPVTTVQADDDLLEAVVRMSARGIRHLPVVDGEGRLVGIVSDRDLRAAVGSPMVALDQGAARVRVGALKVGDVMSRGTITVSQGATLVEVTRVLAERRIGAVPIVDEEGKPVGMLSYVDVLRAVLEA